MRKLAYYTSHPNHYKTYAFLYREGIPRSKGAGLDSVIYDIVCEDASGYRILSATEVRKIWFYKGADKSEREIAGLMKRSKTATHNEIIRKKD